MSPACSRKFKNNIKWMKNHILLLREICFTILVYAIPVFSPQVLFCLFYILLFLLIYKNIHVITLKNIIFNDYIVFCSVNAPGCTSSSTVKHSGFFTQTFNHKKLLPL